MIWRDERELERACAEWRRGELAPAAARLHRILERRPGLLDAIYPLARVLHEQGESPRALELLSGTLDEGRAPRGGIIHRALILYDCGDDDVLAADLEALGPENQSAPALRALLFARRGDWENATFPGPAFWNAEIAGRLLALLEQLHSSDVPASEDRFHHKLFCVPAAENGGPDEQEVGDLLARDAPPPRRDWESLLETLFAARRFERFLSVWESAAVPDGWRDALSKEYWLYSHYALSPPANAAERAQEMATSQPRSVDCHFLHGLCLVRARRPMEAGFAFVRAARLDDVELHAVLVGLAAELSLKLKVAES